jgi:hypothetical protein
VAAPAASNLALMALLYLLDFAYSVNKGCGGRGAEKQRQLGVKGVRAGMVSSGAGSLRLAHMVVNLSV